MGQHRGVTRDLSDDDYARLLRFRTGLRRFLRWSEEQAAAAGLTPAQHQLLLAVRGHRGGGATIGATGGPTVGPTVGEVADALLLKHHSVVELVDRAETAKLVRRRADRDDHRVVRLELTANGARRLEQLSALHLDELRRLASRSRPIWEGLGHEP